VDLESLRCSWTWPRPSPSPRPPSGTSCPSRRCLSASGRWSRSSVTCSWSAARAARAPTSRRPARAALRRRDLLARAESLRREMAELSGEVSGTLRVATVYSIGLHALTRPSRRSSPSTRRSTSTWSTAHQPHLRGPAVGGIDCGIVACPREQPQIEVVPLAEEPMVLIAPPSHPLVGQGGLPRSRPPPSTGSPSSPSITTSRPAP
jgi:hypothetical protein